MVDKPKKLRGFGSMSRERVVEISRLGGKSVPSSKRAFTLDPELAKRAGRKGGLDEKGGRKRFYQTRAEEIERELNKPPELEPLEREVTVTVKRGRRMTFDLK